MAALKEESKLYKELSDSFEDNKKGITLDFYKSAIGIARKYDKEEIQFVLFVLEFVHSDVKTGIDIIDNMLNTGANIFSNLTGKPLQLAFVRSVLTTVLSEK